MTRPGTPAICHPAFRLCASSFPAPSTGIASTGSRFSLPTLVLTVISPSGCALWPHANPGSLPSLARALTKIVEDPYPLLVLQGFRPQARLP